MKHDDKLVQHPEVMDIENICIISPSMDVCKKISDEKDTHQLKTKLSRAKQEKELDTALKDTFPASDATAQY